jgi:hypothetical protein
VKRDPMPLGPPLPQARMLEIEAAVLFYLDIGTAHGSG